MRNKVLYLGIFFIIILLMANQMLGSGLIHELLGMLLLILVIFHMSINRRWWQYIKNSPSQNANYVRTYYIHRTSHHQRPHHIKTSILF